MLHRFFVMFFIFLGFLHFGVWASDQNSPIGKWRTIDDKTGKQKSVVEIYEEHGELKGKILKLIPTEGEDISTKKCNQCPREFKDQPILGMVFLWGLKQEGNEYKNGSVLDPKNGRIYKAKIALEKNGKQLHVRGFIGVALFGRTQIWLRDDE